MNWLDLTLLAFMAVTAAMGWKRGIIRQLFDVAAFAGSYIVALLYSRPFVELLNNYFPLFRWLPDALNQPTLFGVSLGEILIRLAGFLLLYLLVRFTLQLIGGMMHEVFSLPVLGIVNRVCGATLGILKGILLGLILVAVARLLGTPFWVQSLRESVLASYVMEVWPAVYEQMVHFLLITTS
jgi:uncharacterized membrane protein required for colicin V production